MDNNKKEEVKLEELEKVTGGKGTPCNCENNWGEKGLEKDNLEKVGGTPYWLA